MNRFLRAARSERERLNAPGVQELARLQAREARNFGAFLKRVREFKRRIAFAYKSYRAALRVISAPAGPIILPENGHKYHEVAQELGLAAKNECDAESVLAFLGGNDVRIWDRPSALFAVAVANFRLRRIWASVYLRPYAEVLILLLVYQYVLKRRRKSGQYWVIVGDLTTSLIALCVACRVNEQKVVSWQYSNLDFKHFPVTPDCAVILNKNGLELARISKRGLNSGAIFWRPRPETEKVRLEHLDAGPIGAFLNAHAGQDALDVLSRLEKISELPVLVRLHPNCRSQAFVWPQNLQLSSTTEPLDAFARRVSVAVCGNTQAQAQALALGTPVVQFEGLDPLEFDHHGYVAAGIVFGLQRADEWSFNAIRQFYASGEYRSSLENLLGPAPKERKPGLRELLSLMYAESNHSLKARG